MTVSEISNEYQFYFALGYCLFMAILAVIFLKYPPKKINLYYGYRTSRSRKNEDIWKAANSYWAQLNYKLSLTCFIVPIITYFIFPQWNILITVIVNSVLLLLTMPYTEKYLNTHFDKEGNRRI